MSGREEGKVSNSGARIALPDLIQEEGEIDLSMLFGTLWRGKWIIAGCTVVAIFLGGFYAFAVATPLYQANAVVILDTKQDQISGLDSIVGGLGGDTSELNSELEVLKARGLMGKVVERLDLVKDPEFNASLRPQSTMSKLTSGITSGIKSMLGLAQPTAPLSDEDAAQQTRDALVSALIEKVSVSNLRQSFVFNVMVETESARKSKLIADTIVELYILNQIAVKFEATEQATIWLSDRVVELQVELEKAEEATSQFSASTELVSVEGLQALERQIKEARDRIGKAEQAQLELNARLSALMAADTREARAALANDRQLDALLRRLDEGAFMETAFDNRFANVITQLESDITRGGQQLTALKNSENALAAQITQQGQDLIQLQQLTREAEATRLLYEHFLTRLKETAAQQGIQQADSRILSDAVVPRTPASPKKPLILALSAILGMMIGAGLILLREMRNSSFRSADDLERHTGYTVMGQIPTIPGKNRTSILDYLSEKPTSAAAEAVRNLRTSVLLSNVDNPPQVILSTSSIPGEGKTTNSLGLAHNLLGLGKTVLLVEGDIRRRTLNEYFPDAPSQGIVSVLAGDLSFEEAVFAPKKFSGHVLVGEKSGINAADLFASDKFKKFIAEMREKYDFIIVDTPPVLVVPDARIIAQVADAVLFTVKWDSTSKSQVAESLRLFHNSDQRVAGLILSQISAKGMKRYGYGGRYGAYAGYGSDYYES